MSRRPKHLSDWWRSRKPVKPSAEMIEFRQDKTETWLGAALRIGRAVDMEEEISETFTFHMSRIKDARVAAQRTLQEWELI